MTVVSSAVLPIRTQEDIVRVRQATREAAVAQGFSLVDQTKLVTAASELARNTRDYGGGGEVEIARLSEPPRRGVRLVFSDVVLPGEIDGLALARTVCTKYPHIPVVLTTGYTKVFENDPEFPLLRKPYQIAALGRVIHDALGSAEGKPQTFAN